MKKFYILITLLIAIRATSGYSMPELTSKSGYVEPFKMFDNVYYVGDKWVSSYVIDTSAGLVLIDTLSFPYSQWIPLNLKKLGLNDKKIKYIIITHGHADHVGGAQYLQGLYDAKILMTREDFYLSEVASEKSENKFSPPTVNHFVQDSSELIVGDTKFRFYITPGHTKGCLSVDFMVKEQGKLYRAFVVGGHSPPKNNVDLANRFMDSLKRIRALASVKPIVSVNLTNHPHKNKLFKNRDLGKSDQSVNYFIDSKNFFDFLSDQEEIGLNKIAELRENADKPMQTTVNAVAD